MELEESSESSICEIDSDDDDDSANEQASLYSYDAASAEIDVVPVDQQATNNEEHATKENIGTKGKKLKKHKMSRIQKV